MKFPCTLLPGFLEFLLLYTIPFSKVDDFPFKQKMFSSLSQTTASFELLEPKVSPGGERNSKCQCFTRPSSSNLVQSPALINQRLTSLGIESFPDVHQYRCSSYGKPCCSCFWKFDSSRTPLPHTFPDWQVGEFEAQKFISLFYLIFVAIDSHRDGHLKQGGQVGTFNGPPEEENRERCKNGKWMKQRGGKEIK